MDRQGTGFGRRLWHDLKWPYLILLLLCLVLLGVSRWKHPTVRSKFEPMVTAANLDFAGLDKQLVSLEPWELKPEDLTHERVVYNLMNKPGLQWLALQLSLALIGGLILSYWVFYKIAIWVVGPTVKKVSDWAGTVQVATEGGVIYLAKRGNGEEEYMLYAFTLPAGFVRLN